METSRACVVFRCEGKRLVFLQSGLLSRAVLVYFCACRSELSGLMHHVESTNSSVCVCVRVCACVCVCGGSEMLRGTSGRGWWVGCGVVGVGVARGGGGSSMSALQSIKTSHCPPNS